jgi:hypothetical protein
MWVIAKGELPNETTKSVDSLESYVCHFACGESSMKLGNRVAFGLREETRISPCRRRPVRLNALLTLVENCLGATNGR